LRLFDTQATADWYTAAGLARLVAIAHKKSIRTHVQWLPALQTAAIALAPWRGADALRRALGDLLAHIAVRPMQSIRTQAEFESLLAGRIAEELAAAAAEVATWLDSLARELTAVRSALESTKAPSLQPVVGEIRQQLDALFDQAFPCQIPRDWLQQFPRYLAAITARLDRARSNLPRDREQAAVAQDAWERFTHHNETALPPYPIHAGLVEIRWAIEEFRVSLFAQQLGTRIPVSAKRLERMWNSLQADEKPTPIRKPHG
jgi:ATP-dependent helicase HrpA